MRESSARRGVMSLRRGREFEDREFSGRGDQMAKKMCGLSEI